MAAALGPEIRNAVRGLLRTPTVTACAVLCLALGVGATTAIASALSRALLQPLPFREPERLVGVHRVTPASGPNGRWSQSVPNYLDLARLSTQVEGLAALSWGTPIVNLPEAALQVTQMRVTGNLFATLGVRAQLGRLLLADDDRPDAAAVTVISDAMWRRELGADSGIVGRSIVVDGLQTTVVGVTPPDFRVPHGGNSLAGDLWTPIRFTPGQIGQRRSNFLLTLGRLAPGATVESAHAELRRIFANLVAAHPELAGENVRVAPLHAESMEAVRRPLLLVFAAVCFVLLIAATNVAALLLARAVHRQREVAVRAALGASRWDVVRPALLESLVLTITSAVLGLAIGAAGVKTIGTLAAASMPQLAGMGLDWRVLAFALGLTILVALVCGAAPAWRGAAVDPQDALRGGRGGGAGREHHRALHALVVLEIALSLVLLIGAGLVLRGVARLAGYDPGFDASRIVTMRLTTPATRHPDGTAVRGFVEPALAAIRAVPGVDAAAAISAIPYITWGNNSPVRYEGRPEIEPSRLPVVEQRSVTPGFFEVTGQRLIDGRVLREGDDGRPGAVQAVVVNEALVRRDFAGRSPVGTRYHTGDTTFATIVGVVSDVRNAGPIEAPRPEMYRPYRQVSPGASSVGIMVRVQRGDPMAITSEVRRAVAGVDADAAVSLVRSMEEVIARSIGRPRFYLNLLSSFAAIALVLAAAGLYGVLSYAVAQRTREIGIRAALGSPRAALIRLFALEGFQLVVAGVVIGAASGAAVMRLMTSMLYGVSHLDVRTWAAAIGTLLLAAMLAALLPARRAARVDPLVAIQSD